MHLAWNMENCTIVIAMNLCVFIYLFCSSFMFWVTNESLYTKIERETKNTKTFKRIWQPKIVLWTNICAFGVYASSINKLDIVFTDRMYSTAFVVGGASAAAVAFVAVFVFFVFLLYVFFFLYDIKDTLNCIALRVHFLCI